MSRTVTIPPFVDAAGNGVAGEVSFVLVDLDGTPIDGFVGTAAAIVTRHTVVIPADSTGETIELEPNAEISPASYWHVTVKNSERCFPGVNCTLVVAAGPISLPELLAVGAPSDPADFWGTFLLSQDERDALNAAPNPPSGSNPLATMADVGAGLAEAPQDGTPYGRQDAAWVGADPAGSAAAVQASLSAHQAASNPHGIAPAGIGAATAAQGALADTAIQPGDNVSGLVNDAGYLISPLSDDLDADGNRILNPTIKDGFISIPGGVTDLSMVTLLDRNQLSLAAAAGAVTVTITGAGSAPTDYDLLLNGSADYYQIASTDATTTKIEIAVDLGVAVNHYGSRKWQPFVLMRLANDNGDGSAFSATFFRKITVEVSTDNSTWVRPAGGEWETTNAGQSQADTRIDGLWMGQHASQATTWRYVRFTLEDRQENSGYASKDMVWISQIGMRHAYANFTKRFLDVVKGGSVYGSLSLPDLGNYASDAAAASGGVAVGELYHNAGALRVRIS